jgi:hypothetical protein
MIRQKVIDALLWAFAVSALVLAYWLGLHSPT